MKKRNLYFGIIYVLAFIIMVIGSTLAYFSYRTASKKDTVNIDSADGGNITIGIVQTAGGGGLVPLNDEDVMTAYNNDCMDINKNDVCNSYEIIINNDSDLSYLNGSINFVKSNNLVNLYYMVLDDKGEIFIPKTQIIDSNSYDMGKVITMTNGEVKKYNLLVWIKNLDENQNSEMAGYYTGTLSYTAVSDVNMIGKIESSYMGG